MSNDVLDFLATLATEPQVFSDFLSDAETVLEREGVGEAARKALLSRDPSRVHAAIRGQAEEYEAAYQKSANNAKIVFDILGSDPNVAGWLYTYFAQAIQYAQATSWNTPGHIFTTDTAKVLPVKPTGS